MRLLCTRENLERGLSITARITDRKANLPILNNVLLDAKKEGLTMTATNLEMGIKTVVRGKIEQPGQIAIPAKLAHDFVVTLPNENIILELEENNLKLKGKNHQTVIKGVSPEDFPALPEIKKTTPVILPANDLNHALHKVIFAASADESRPELNGVYVQISRNNIVFAATDSYRLAERTIETVDHGLADQSVILPTKTLQEVYRILSSDNIQEAMFYINESQALFILDVTDVVTRLISGSYPDYKQIIPTSFAHTIYFERESMIKAIKTTALFCKQGINDIRLKLDKRSKEISISAENTMHGKNISRVETSSENQEADIVFNYKFLLDGLDHISSNTAKLKLNDATSPALVTGEDDKGFLYIVMPIKQ